MSSLQEQLIKKGLVQNIPDEVKSKNDISGYVRKRENKREFMYGFNWSRLERPFQYAYWIYKSDFSKTQCTCALCGKEVEFDGTENPRELHTDEYLDDILRSNNSRGHILAKLADVPLNRVIRIGIVGYENLSCVLACVECMIWHMSNKKFFVKPK